MTDEQFNKLIGTINQWGLIFMISIAIYWTIHMIAFYRIQYEIYNLLLQMQSFN